MAGVAVVDEVLDGVVVLTVAVGVAVLDGVVAALEESPPPPPPHAARTMATVTAIDTFFMMLRKLW